MASALEKLVNCSICLETYTNPKLLQCHHVYCQQCLIKLVHRNQQGQLSLTCPNCRHVTPVPGSGVGDLQAAFHVNQLLEIVEEQKKAKACTIVSQEKVESASPHNGGSVVCPEHEKEVDLYCDSCGDTICWKCIMKESKHHSHQYQEISKAFESYKNELTLLLEPMEKQLTTTRAALRQLDVHCDKISNQQAAIKANIHSTIKQLREALDMRQAELISQLHQLTQVKLKSLAVQRAEIETTQAQLSSCLHFIRENLKTYNEREALLMKDTTIRQVKELNSIFQPDRLEPNTEVDINFSTLVDLTSQCQSYGIVYAAGSPDPSKCCATGTGVERALVGEKSTAVLQTLNFNSQPCKVPQASISAELISEISKSKVECTIEKTGHSHYEISYHPIIKGRHQLHIKVESKHIRGSPFCLTARSSVKKLGTPIHTIGGLKGPRGITINKKGEVVIAEVNGHCVSVFAPTGERLRSFGMYGSGQGQFQYPYQVVVDANGDVLVADALNHRIQKFTIQGEFLTAVGTQGSGPQQFSYPRGIACNAIDGRVYVSGWNGVVQILNPDLSYLDAFGKQGSNKGQLSDPRQLALDSTGNVYVADRGNHRIQVFTPEGKFLRMFRKRGEGRGDLKKPWGVAVDSNDRVYVSEYDSDCISVFTSDGQFVASFGEKGTVQLAVDHSVVYVCSSNDCVELF